MSYLHSVDIWRMVSYSTIRSDRLAAAVWNQAPLSLRRLNPNTLLPVLGIITSTALKLYEKKAKVTWDIQTRGFPIQNPNTANNYNLLHTQVNSKITIKRRHFSLTSCCSLSTALVTFSSPGCLYFWVMVSFRLCFSSSLICRDKQTLLSLI